jgi:hypothetical protein
LDGDGSGIVKNSRREMEMTQVIATNPKMINPMSTIVSRLGSGDGKEWKWWRGRKVGMGMDRIARHSGLIYRKAEIETKRWRGGLINPITAKFRDDTETRDQ